MTAKDLATTSTWNNYALAWFTRNSSHGYQQPGAVHHYKFVPNRVPQRDTANFSPDHQREDSYHKRLAPTKSAPLKKSDSIHKMVPEP